MTPSPRNLAAIAAAAALLVAGCSGSGGTSSSPSKSAGPQVSGPAPGSSEPTKLAVTHPTVWLCRPGMARNPCEGGLDATVIGSDGKQSIQEFQPAAHPKIDCFYVYPTLSEGKSINAPLAPEPAAIAVTRSQAARFASVCRLFVPVYRQLTLRSITSGGFGNVEAQALASADVDSAWHDYLNNDNHGRGVVLIGHSQGAGQLTRLIRSEIDKDRTERSRLVSALIIGGNVLVPQGKDVGGAFANIPACRQESQTGCVVAYSSFHEPPPANALFGRATNAQSLNPGATTTGMQVLCVNPAALAGGSATLKPYEPTRTIGGHLPATPPVALANLRRAL